MSGASKAQKFTNYINNLPTKEAKIQALIDAQYFIGNPNYASPEEAEAYDTLKADICTPLETLPDGTTRLNVREYENTLDILYNMQEKAIRGKADEELRWKKFNESADNAQGLDDAQKKEKATYQSHLYSDSNFNAANLDVFMTGIFRSERMDQIGNQLDGRWELKDAFFERHMRSDISELEENIEKEPVSSDAFDYDFDAAQELSNLKEDQMRARVPQNALDSFAYNPSKRAKKLEEAGVKTKEENEMSEFVTLHKNLQTKMPWRTEAENGSFRIEGYAAYGMDRNTAKAEIAHKLTQLDGLYAHMQQTMKSTFRDNQEYRDLKASLARIQELRTNLQDKDPKTWTTRETNEAANRINQVMKDAGKYVETHLSSRSSPNGTNRFDAAMSIVGICNANAAYAIKDEVNKARSGEKKPQIIDMDKLSEKFGLAFDEPKAYQIIQNREAMAADKNYNLNKLKIADIENERGKIRDRLMGATEEEQKANLAELGRLGKGVGLDHQDKSSRVMSNIIGYFCYTHPELADKPLSEIAKNKDFRHAREDYAKFLRANQIFEEDPEKPGQMRMLPKKKADKALQNMADYYKGWINNQNNQYRVPDLSNTEIRRNAMDMMYRHFQESIDCSQNETGLYANHMEYVDKYEGGVAAHSKEFEGVNALGFLGKAAAALDQQKGSTADYLAAKVFLEETRDIYIGKTGAEMAAEGGTQKLGALHYALEALAPIYLSGKNAAQLQEVKNYIDGKAPMPESLREFLGGEQAKDIIKTAEDAVKDDFRNKQQKYNDWKKAENEKAASEKEAAKKEKKSVERTSFKDIMKEFEKEHPKHSGRKQSFDTRSMGARQKNNDMSL